MSAGSTGSDYRPPSPPSGSYPIIVGNSFRNEEETHHLLRYKFLPTTALGNDQGSLVIEGNADKNWILELKNTQNENEPNQFRAINNPSKEIECILLYDPETKQYRLEQLASTFVFDSLRPGEKAKRAAVVDGIVFQEQQPNKKYSSPRISPSPKLFATPSPRFTPTASPKKTPSPKKKVDVVEEPVTLHLPPSITTFTPDDDVEDDFGIDDIFDSIEKSLDPSPPSLDKEENSIPEISKDIPDDYIEQLDIPSDVEKDTGDSLGVVLEDSSGDDENPKADDTDQISAQSGPRSLFRVDDESDGSGSSSDAES